jgi:hypothetical protein
MSRRQDLHDRLGRAHSWMEAARALPSDQMHAAFVFLYIAFNALYGKRRYEGTEDEARRDREEFLKRLSVMQARDMRYGQGILLKALKACRQQGASLIRNAFLRDTYWSRYQKATEIREQFGRAAMRAAGSLEKGQCREFLDLVLRRLTVLRNQVIHGCVTYGSKSKGIESLETGLAVLKELVPAFHTLMSRYGNEVEWPPIPYPRTGSERHPAEDRWAE